MIKKCHVYQPPHELRRDPAALALICTKYIVKEETALALLICPVIGSPASALFRLTGPCGRKGRLDLLRQDLGGLGHRLQGQKHKPELVG